MSNARKPAVPSFDALVKEVTKEPFRMSLPDGDTLIVKQPTGRQAIEAQEMAIKGTATPVEQLRTILGDDGWEQMEPLLMDAPGTATGVLVTRIMEHFGFDLGEDDSRS